MRVRNIFSFIGLDKSIAYSSGARVVQALAGIGSIFFITRFLTDVEQGFYYTFASLLAIQVFFELGLNNVLTQFVAHEVSDVEFENGHGIRGNIINISRLSSLLRFSLRWYFVISIIFFLALLVFGFIFFSSYNNHQSQINWKLPWILVSLSSALNLFISPVFSVLMGLNKVKEVNKIRFYQQLFIPLVSWLGLYSGAKLYVLGISSLLIFIWGVYRINATHLSDYLKSIWKVKISEKVNYKNEIWPFQWKIAISWISGYFIYQLFNPILFKFEGPVAAGQMGMTIQILNAIQAFSFSWMQTKIPTYSTLIAKKDFFVLDQLFYKTLLQLLVVCLITIAVFLVMVDYLDQILGMSIQSRFLNGLPLYFMASTIVANQVLSSFANYLRCHKREPLMTQSVIVAFVCLLSTYFSTKYYGVIGMTMSYSFIIIFISLPWVYMVFKKKKYEWHRF